MVRFENIEFLYLLLSIPLLVIAYIIFRNIRLKSLSKFGDISLINVLYHDTSEIKPTVKFVLLISSFGLIILGVANLQVGTKIEKATRAGVEVMIAIDVSRSMDADDIKPSRLQRAKQAVSKLIDNLQNDKIGLIVFAGDAYLQLPLTTDFSAAKLFLSAVSTSMVPRQGTAIGSAIELSVKSLMKDDKLKKAIIIITDGENHEDDAIGAASMAASNNIVVHTIGMGTIQGGPIPVYRNGQRVDFARDAEGSVIFTKLDPNMLEQIAVAGGGKFILAAGVDPDLSSLLNKISGMEKKEFTSRLFTDYESRFQYFFGLAFILLLVELFLSERKNKFLTSLKLFEEKK